MFMIVMMCTCRPDIKKQISTHYVDTTLNRTQQIEKCASCHSSIFENWKIGPHANAYSLLMAHDKLIDTSRSFPQNYNAFVEANMETICSTCHTGQNIYETNFKGINHYAFVDSITKNKFPAAFEQAYGRITKPEKDLQTGVDCITCHVQGQQVVTNESSKASDTLGLIKSKLFSNNMSCYSCHHHQVNSMKELVQNKQLSNEISCVNCHQEYTPEGKGTHYFYWRNDAPHKKRPTHLDIFNSLTIQHIKKSEILDLQVSWTNTMMPHGFSECGEAKCKVIAIYNNGKQETLTEIYLNRKNFFDAIDKMPEHFRIGKNGDEFNYNMPITRKVSLKGSKLPQLIRLIGYVKPQYWSSEKEFLKVFEKELPYESIR